MSLFKRKKNDAQKKKLELELAEAAQEKLKTTKVTEVDPGTTESRVAALESGNLETIAKIEESRAASSTVAHHQHSMKEVNEMSDIRTTVEKWRSFYTERLQEKLGQREGIEGRKEKIRADLREMEELLTVLNEKVDEVLEERYEELVIEPINQKKGELSKKVAEIEEEAQQLEADVRCLNTALERLDGYIRE